MRESYFSKENLNTRFFCYYGNTGDLFVDETLYPLTLKQALHRELTLCGYERIVFYSYAQGAYFLDRKSRKLWYGRKQEEPEKLQFSNKLLKGNLGTKAAMEEEPLAFAVTPTEMLLTAERFLMDTEIPTAIIFPDGVGALKEFAAIEDGKLLDHFLVRVTEKQVNQILNPNVAVFLFNRSVAQVETILSGKEREAVHRYLLDGGFAAGHIIPLPNGREIRNMLNYLRIHGDGKKKLMVDCREIAKISGLIAKKIAQNAAEKETYVPYVSKELRAVDLSGTMQYLMQQYLEQDRPLNLEECRRICKKGEGPSALERLERLVGMRSVKEAVREFLCLHENMEKRKGTEPLSGSRLSMPGPVPKQPVNLHFVLSGNNGTGKTTVAKLLGEILCEYGFLPTGHTVLTTPAQLKSDVVGGSERNIRENVKLAMGGVLFIDEAYELAGDDVYNSAIVTELVADMPRYQGRFSVILAGYPGRMEELMRTNEGLRRRFANWILIEDYTPSELTEIFSRMARERGMKTDGNLERILPEFFEEWYYARRSEGKEWGNAGEAENLLGNMQKRCRGDVLTLEMIPEELKRYTTHQAEDEAMEKLEALIGLQRVKEEIRKSALYVQMKGTKQPRHFIFAGNPGTGKSTVARILGKVLKNIGVLESGHLVERKAGQLIAGYVGQTEEKARKVFESARGGVLFIDEAYGLIPGKENKTDFGGAVLELLLEYTDPANNMPICVICAGYAEAMEEFLQQNEGLASRFDIIPFESYTVEELLKMLEVRLAGEGYEAEPGYLDAARRDFIKNLELISKTCNGRYVSRYIKASEDKLFLRLDKTYGHDVSAIPREERHRLCVEDAPDDSLMGGIKR